MIETHKKYNKSDCISLNESTESILTSNSIQGNEHELVLNPLNLKSTSKSWKLLSLGRVHLILQPSDSFTYLNKFFDVSLSTGMYLPFPFEYLIPTFCNVFLLCFGT